MNDKTVDEQMALIKRGTVEIIQEAQLREKLKESRKKKRPLIGYDYVHSMVDDHSRLAYSEIHDDESGPTCAGFLTRPPRTSPLTASRSSNGSSPTTPSPTAAPPRSPTPWPRSAPDRSSSAPTAPGRTARSSGSTAPSHRSGPTGRSSPATPSEPQPLPRGSSTTTLDDATQPSVDSHQSVDCHQPDGRVHLGGQDGMPTPRGRRPPPGPHRRARSSRTPRRSDRICLDVKITTTEERRRRPWPRSSTP